MTKIHSLPHTWIFLLIILYKTSDCGSSNNRRVDSNIRRFKREVPPNKKVFVIPKELQNPSGQLFTVAPSLNVEPGVTYKFANDTPGLTLDKDTGIISKTPEFDQNATEINFDVNVSDSDKVIRISVTMKIISRSLDDPVFSNFPVPMWAVCPEWIRPGTVIYTLLSRDLDYGATDVVYTLESGGEGYFGINPSTGEVFIIGRQQFRLGMVYTLVVSAKSRGMRLPGSPVGYSQSLNIKIGSKEPQFFMTPYNITFFENAGAMSIIGTVKAKSFQNLQVSFTMTPTSDLFILNSMNGSLTLTKQLTFALDTRQYFFNITAIESYSNFVTTAPLIITLMSINHVPTFPAPHYTLYDIPESLAVGSELLTMVVRDYDPGEMGRLSFTTSMDSFDTKLTSVGVASLKLIKPLDYESVINGEYKFTVVAYDGGSPSLSSTATVQIWVKNENNKAPVFDPPTQDITVREGIRSGQLFYIQAYDPDGDRITFEFNEASNDRYFKVDPSSGAVTLNKDIVASQSISSFNLSITITDGSHSTSAVVKVYVYRVNTQPTFPQCRSYMPRVTEDQPASINSPITILNMTAKDNDIDENGNLTFQIFGNEVVFFRVIKSGERMASFQQIRSMNRDTPNVLRYDGYVYIPRLHYNSKLLRVLAYDLDYGVNGMVKYSMNYSFSDMDCQTDLSVDEQTGWILWKGTTALEKTYNCIINASDGGSPSLSDSVSVILIFSNSIEVPIWTSPVDETPVSILENATIGTLVASLNATISNRLSIIFFMPKDSLPVFNGAGNFYASQTQTGSSASMNVLVSENLPRRNFRPEYFLRCRAYVTTSNGNQITNVVRLNVIVKDVNNEAPRFLGIDGNGIYTAAVTQYSVNGDYVVTVTAVDMDSEWPNNRVRYSLLNNFGSFIIDSDSGEIRVSSDKTTQIFDPDIIFMYELIVVATDGAPSSNGSSSEPNKAQTKVQVIVSGGTLGIAYFTDNFTTSLSEGLPRSTTVLNATATTPVTPSGGRTSIVRYNIQGGNDLRNFAVDPNTGRIYTVRPVMYSMANSYQLTYAVFTGLRNNITNVFISIKEENIFPPKLDQSNYTYAGLPLQEKNIPKDFKVATVHATSNKGNPVTYTSSRPSDFTVDSSGQVIIARNLSRDSPDGFAPQQVTIEANDGLNPPSYAVVTVNLTDINDHRPLFELCCTSGSVRENSPPGSPVMQLRAWDADFGPNAIVKYSLLDDPSGNFNVNPDGMVIVNKTLDFETRQKYSIKVLGRDQGPQALSSDTTVYIYITDVNERPPRFLQTNYITSIPEELEVSSIVLAVGASDDDPMDQLTFTIQDDSGSKDAEYFYVETLQTFNGSFETSTAQRLSTAIIKIAKRIDFDVSKKSIYSIKLLARDSSAYQAVTSVTINVTDINDNPPVFKDPHPKAIDLNENVPLQFSVMTFTAEDVDSGINGEFTYSIDYEYSDPRFMFQVDGKSGEVTVRSKLNFEWKDKMEVKVLAIDKGLPPLTGTATLTVNVKNVDDSAPMLRNKIPVDPIPVQMDAKKGSQVYCLNVFDPDNQNSQNNFNYQLACDGLNSERCSDFTMSQDGCLLANRDGYSNLGYRSYIVPVKITKKSGSQSSMTEIIGLTIQDSKPGAPKSGTKNVQVMNYVGANGGFSAIPLGSVLVLNPGAPDVMQYVIDPASPSFYLDGQQIWLRGNVSAGEQTANVKVSNKNFAGQTDSTIKVNLKFVNESALKSASSFRIIGLRDARDLLQPAAQGTVLDSLIGQIGEAIGQNPVVEVLSIWMAYENVSDSSVPVVDVLYAVHGSPYYSPEKLSTLVWNNRKTIFEKTKLNISMSPVDLCRSEFYNCWDSGCETKLVVNDSQPRLVNADERSFVGITAEFRQSCSCPHRTSGSDSSKCLSDSCLNGGTCMVNNSVISCLCPAGYDGQRCQKIKVSVRDGYILLPSLTSCEVSHLSLEFLADQDSPQTSLLLYNGPLSNPSTGPGTYEEVTTQTYQPRDFLILELVNGRPKLRIDFGDGEISSTFTDSNLPSLNDNKWHSIDIIHVGIEVRMIVDKCGKVTINESIKTSVMETSKCEVRVEAPKQRFLLNTMAPLQLGGRWDSTNEYPQGWSRTAFRGCFRNLKHNGETYDLSLGSWKQYSNAQDKCSNDNCNSCPANATCLPNVILGTSICQCPPGFRGSSCNIVTTTKYFDANGYAFWKPSEKFMTALNASYPQTFWFADRVELSFRTRQANGILFMAQSFTGLERYLLEVKNCIISLAFDLGSGDINLSLPNVNISDGGWHRILIVRYGNMVEMHLDSGDGRRYNASLPTNEHRLLKINSGAALGDVSFNNWRKQFDTKNSLGKSCINDIRYGGYWWPLSESENSYPDVTASVTLSGSTDTGCAVGSCSNDQCPLGKICEDIWQGTQCICENYLLTSSNKDCISTSCLNSPCLNGATCVVVEKLVSCICPPGWYGPTCNSSTPVISEVREPKINLAAAIVLPIIFGLLLLLLLALLIWWCCYRKKDSLLYDEPDKDIRENVIAYDDEGAGEEDNYAFDLSKLQKTPFEMAPINDPYFITGPVYANKTGTGRALPAEYPSVADFISDRLGDIDKDPNFPLDDSRVNFTFEGWGSLAGSLSSLASNDGDRDADFDWLEDAGPQFEGLADLYGDARQV